MIFLSFAEALRLAQQSACQIMPGRDAYGRNFYRLVDRQGRMVLNTANYSVAMQTVQTDVRCRLY